MPFRVVVLGRAKSEVQAIFVWLAERSSRGALRWLQAFADVTTRLEEEPLACAWADEEELEHLEIRQIVFKTRRGKPYRALFKVIAEEVRILHVRGPGQAPLKPGDLLGR
jgi:plasmid stabilization system protein ParE